MKFFKFLAIAFPIYVSLAFLASNILNLGIKLPEIINILMQFIVMSLILATLPFSPILKIFGMYTNTYWILPTNSGIILSAITWEIIFILLFFMFYKLKKNKEDSTFKSKS